MNLWLPRHLYERVRLEARVEGSTTGAVVRRMIVEVLSSREEA